MTLSPTPRLLLAGALILALAGCDTFKDLVSVRADEERLPGERLSVLVLEKAIKADPEIADDRIICIGDGPQTDVSGAAGAGLDALFITGGLSAEETGTAPSGQPDAARLESIEFTGVPRARAISVQPPTWISAVPSPAIQIVVVAKRSMKSRSWLTINTVPS